MAYYPVSGGRHVHLLHVLLSLLRRSTTAFFTPSENQCINRIFPVNRRGLLGLLDLAHF